MIKNTAADMSIQEMESKKEELKEKRKLEWRTKSKVLMLYERDLSLPWRGRKSGDKTLLTQNKKGGTLLGKLCMF